MHSASELVFEAGHSTFFKNISEFFEIIRLDLIAPVLNTLEMLNRRWDFRFPAT